MKLELKRIEEPFVFRLTNESGIATTIDASPSIGGRERGLRPMELLAGSLAGCAAIDILSILKKKRLHSEDFSVQIEAVRKDEVPAIFERISLNILIDDELDYEVVRKTTELVIEKYCSVSASLDKQIILDFKINNE